MDKLKDNRFSKFHKTFLEKIAPQYAFFEKSRKKIISDIPGHFLTTITIMGSIMTILYLLSNDKDFSVLIFSIVLVTTASFIGIIFGSNKKYKVFLKTQMMSELLNAFGNIQWLNSHTDDYYQTKIEDTCAVFRLSETMYSKIQDSGLFVRFNTYEIDDIFKGNYKGINFQIVETALSAKGYKTSIRSFKGLILNYELNKTIISPTIVTSKRAKMQKDSSKLAIFIVCVALVIACHPLFITPLQYIRGNWALIFVIIVSFFVLLSKFPVDVLMSKETNFSDMQKVILEDPKFNKKFNVYSDNQVEARCLVTPAFMEKFHNIKTAFGAKNIRCSFFDNNLMVAIETNKDLFELGSLFKSVHDGLTVYHFYREIRAIYDLIDYFNLNEKFI